jgi:hypothetical protein
MPIYGRQHRRHSLPKPKDQLRIPLHQRSLHTHTLRDYSRPIQASERRDAAKFGNECLTLIRE